MDPMDLVNEANCRLLTGWKTIAQYLGVSVVTAKRWRRLAGLPVHTPAGRSVVAFEVEIRRWVSCSSAVNRGASSKLGLGGERA